MKEQSPLQIKSLALSLFECQTYNTSKSQTWQDSYIFFMTIVIIQRLQEKPSLWRKTILRFGEKLSFDLAKIRPANADF